MCCTQEYQTFIQEITPTDTGQLLARALLYKSNNGHLRRLDIYRYCTDPVMIYSAGSDRWIYREYFNSLDWVANLYHLIYDPT